MSSNPPDPGAARFLDGSDQSVPVKTRSSTVQGGYGGLPFDDYHSTREVVTEICVRAAQNIIAVQVAYEGSGAAPQHGGGGVDCPSFSLDKDEKIVRIDGRNSAVIEQLQFFTNKGRSSAIYGGNAGTVFSWSVPEGYHFRYFTGKSGSQVDSLQAHFYKSNCDQLVPVKVRSGTYQGGYGGLPFDDYHSTRRGVTEICVRASQYIIAIQVVYDGCGAAPQHGGGGGGSSSFSLDKDEKIVRIDGRNSAVIEQLQFFTNRGRSSAIYGGNGGTAFSWSVPEGYYFRYFTGKSGSQVDSLQAHFYKSNRDLLVPVKIWSGTFQGGYGGLPFDDHHSTREVVSEICVRASQNIITLQVVYEGSGAAPQHGCGGGDSPSFSLDKDEKIVRIDGRNSALIEQLQFFTNKGRCSAIYGGNGGTAFSWSAPGGYYFRYFTGKSGSQVDSLQAHFDKTNYDQLVPVKMRSGTFQGGYGGLPFDDYHSTRRVVTNICVRASQQVIAVQVVYEGSGAAPQHGGGGVDCTSFSLDKDEKIVRIDGRNSTVIEQLQFFTNKGRSSAIYGGNGGTAFSWSVPGGYYFRYFTGKSGCQVDALQAHFDNE